MAGEKIDLPIGKRTANVLPRLVFRLDTILVPEADTEFTCESGLSAEEVASRLALPKDDQLSCSVTSGGAGTKQFSLQVNSDPVSMFLSPSIEGYVEPTVAGSKTHFRVVMPRWVRTIMNAPIMALLAVLIGYLISSYLLPHPVLLLYSLAAVIAMPIVLCTITTLLFHVSLKTQLAHLLPFLRDSSQCEEFQEANSMQSKFARTPLIAQRLIATALCGVLYLSAAFGLHALAWDYWCQGKYQACADLCHPVATFAQVVLAGSATAADCKYYLAECYRCLDHLPEAEALYGETLQLWQKSLDPSSTSFADVSYNLGRVYEESGRFHEAIKEYNTALSNFSRAFGENNMVCAKVLNRLATVELKTGDLDAAAQHALRASHIDEAYGKQHSRMYENLNDLAAVEVARGQYARAVELETAALEQSKSKSSMGIVASYINLARAYLGLGDEDNAQSAFDKARNMLRAHDVGTQVSVDQLVKLSKTYGLSLKSQRAEYEVPNFETRSAMTFTGEGRI